MRKKIMSNKWTYEILQRTPQIAIVAVSSEAGVIGFEVFRMQVNTVKELNGRMGVPNVKITTPVYDSYLDRQHFSDGCTFFRSLADAVKSFNLKQSKSRPLFEIKKITLLSYAESSTENAMQAIKKPAQPKVLKKKKKAA